jgi:hypothetical protein
MGMNCSISVTNENGAGICKALSEAEERFKSLTTVGYTAAVRDVAGKATVTRSFDPTAEETLFFPRLVGG